MLRGTEPETERAKRESGGGRDRRRVDGQRVTVYCLLKKRKIRNRLHKLISVCTNDQKCPNFSHPVYPKQKPGCCSFYFRSSSTKSIHVDLMNN